MYKLRRMFEPKVPLQDFSEKVQQTGPEPSTQSKITSSLPKKKKKYHCTPSLGICPKLKVESQKSHLYTHVYRSLIHNSREMEVTQMSFNR